MLFTILTVASILAHGIAIAGVLLVERRHPSSTLAWLLALVFLPIVGLVIYFIFGRMRARRLAKRSVQTTLRLLTVFRKCGVRQKIAHGEAELDYRTDSFLRLCARLSSTPASRHNDADLLVDAATTYDSIIAAMEQATDHIHVQFYIIQPDETGIALRTQLVECIEAGVDVRVLTDAIGSMALPADFWDPLIEAGGKAATYRPVSRFFTRLRRRDRIDFRNHRKIVIVDGRVGFTGGINVGREYLGLDPDMGHWRDTHVKIEGPAVLSLQSTFAEDWLAATGELIEEPRYYPDLCDHEPGGDIIQVVDSGPDRKFSPIAHIVCQALALSRERVWITNPYFIPSAAINDALIRASLRGVDVRLLLPSRSDNLVVNLAARSYYRRLLEAGARVFEYKRGFVHAKTMLVDDWIGTVGSANMDMRSFYLNYELNAFVVGSEFANEMAHQFEEDLDNATEVELATERQLGYHRRLLRAGARLFSPLL